MNDKRRYDCDGARVKLNPCGVVVDRVYPRRIVLGIGSENGIQIRASYEFVVV